MLYAIGDRANQLYLVGAMGCASSVGLGLALQCPQVRVIVIDGDGAMLMRLGALAAIGRERPDNLLHVVLDNRMHESTGGQSTGSALVDLAAVAQACGYEQVYTVARPEDTQAIPVLREMDAQKLAAGLQPGSPLIANLDGFPWRAQLPALAPRIISQIDGRKSVAEIYTAMGAQGGGLPRWEDFYAQFEDLYVKLNGVNHLLLRFRT